MHSAAQPEFPTEKSGMATDFISLAVIAAVAFVAPVIAQAIPRKPIPETVLLLVFGAILGPYALDVINPTDSIDLLSELGLAFLFLLAGYEINPKMLTSYEGKKGLRTWLITFVLAVALIFLHPNIAIGGISAIPMAIVLTTTALGTLMPILRERELSDTKVGRAVISFGTWGRTRPRARYGNFAFHKDRLANCSYSCHLFSSMHDRRTCSCTRTQARPFNL